MTAVPVFPSSNSGIVKFLVCHPLGLPNLGERLGFNFVHKKCSPQIYKRGGGVWVGQKSGGWVQSWVGGSCPKYPHPSYKRCLTLRGGYFGQGSLIHSSVLGGLAPAPLPSVHCGPGRCSCQPHSQHAHAWHCSHCVHRPHASCANRLVVESAKALRALVLELYGNGKSSYKGALAEIITAAVKKGLIVVAATQCAKGLVNVDAHSIGREMISLGVLFTRIALFVWQCGHMGVLALLQMLMHELYQDIPRSRTSPGVSWLTGKLRGGPMAF